ncbi:gas vesicle protein K [Actinomycetospora soli]|uniref:gas vesicle protein K n=1 Tax=Actinomycetospora soli TaxID=2893887 RepID=UPI001E3C76C3|nr:gas vesicle protein K [Actinomycetospora soli]MCD2190346.1 gas vesicle protein K [Actinomycetospora soli]
MADPSENRIEIDKDAVRRDLMKLVLTIVELLRQLMERQAIRRVENSELTEQQEEDLGTALMLLSDAMDELTEQFGLTPADLNLDLGPLGPLLPRDR